MVFGEKTVVKGEPEDVSNHFLLRTLKYTDDILYKCSFNANINVSQS